MCLQTAGLCIRPWRVASGAVGILPAGPAPSVSGTSCRPRWRSSTPKPRLVREHLLSVPHASSMRVMSSTGGILRQEGACARIVPTTSSGWRWQSPLCARKPPETPAYWTSLSAFSRPPLTGTEDSYYDSAHASEENASLYDHCVRAILRGLGRGSTGLPLIGSGDWNDGMNMVGEHGAGESVWLGFLSS